MNLKKHIKRSIRRGLYNTLGRIAFRKSPAKPNILLFSSRRSGSTWLVELLSSEPGVRRILEPYDTLQNHNHYAGWLPMAKGGHFFNLDTQGEERLFQYYEDLDSGRKIINNQWKLWEKDRHFFYDRTLLKIFYAKNYMAEFARRYKCDVIYQVRHPVACALSVHRLGWFNSLDGFLGDPSFVEKNLTTEQRELLAVVQKEGTEIEKHVAGWFVENLVPTQIAAEMGSPVLRYEDMVTSPEDTVRLLQDRLALSSGQKMLERYGEASFNSFDSASRITGGDRNAIAGYWREKFAPSEHPRVADLFSILGNPHYSSPTSW